MVPIELCMAEFTVCQRNIDGKLYWSAFHEGQNIDLICKSEADAKHVCGFLNKKNVVALAPRYGEGE